ncbi:MAG: 50S ribosomal protein L22 [Planctomycetota bacterium]
MQIRGEQLKQRAAEAGASVEALAQAVERTGLEGPRAVTAVRNWMTGKDHPRCKPSDIRKLAQTLGCQVSDIARFVSQVRTHRGSTQKARLVADLIRGRGANEAKDILHFSHKRAAVNVTKCLDAAITDAADLGADTDRLWIAHCTVDEGPQIKRFKAKDRGRAHPIIKQTSHITIGVEERL